MDFEPYKALYIHLPFCKKRCSYCDFYTHACKADSEEMDAYIDKLIMDIRASSKKGLLGSIETVYLGGGTPTFLGNKRLSRLLYALSLFMHLTPDVECTLEANPDSLTEHMVKDLFALGVTRLSIGVQSFDDSVLSFLGRVHSADKARKTIEIAQERFSNISIDLICGIPGQTLASFENDLKIALSLGVKHISVYPLTLEENTPLYSDYLNNVFNFDEDAGAEMMVFAQSFLTSQGMNRYEVANYAFPGFESKHNSSYWMAKPYLGLGDGAVSMKQNAYTRIREKDGIVQDSLNQKQLTAENLMLSMRMTKGVSFLQVKKVSNILPQAEQIFEELLRDGFVARTTEGYVPTDKGWLYGNHLYGKIYELAP